jgi:hypothetical protein
MQILSSIKILINTGKWGSRDFFWGWGVVVVVSLPEDIGEA